MFTQEDVKLKDAVARNVLKVWALLVFGSLCLALFDALTPLVAYGLFSMSIGIGIGFMVFDLTLRRD